MGQSIEKLRFFALQSVRSFKKTRLYAFSKKTFNTRGISRFFKVNYYKLFKSSRTFSVHGHVYNYFYHAYNNAWRSERTVEIPIAWALVKTYGGKNILEVGNVLSHYFPVSHDVLDKYEKAPGVLNLDVVDFHPDKKYDLIVAISTLEHVGWDEVPKDPGKFLRALDNLKKCLAKGGRILITLPLGQNPEMDKLLDMKKCIFTEQYSLKRVSAENDWLEVAWKDIRGSKNNSPFRAANGLVIGIIDWAPGNGKRP